MPWSRNCRSSATPPAPAARRGHATRGWMLRFAPCLAGNVTAKQNPKAPLKGRSVGVALCAGVLTAACSNQAVLELFPSETTDDCANTGAPGAAGAPAEAGDCFDYQTALV